MQQIRKYILITSLVLAGSVLFCQAITGIVNDDSVRIRETPGLNGTVLGKLNKNTSVIILGRTDKRDFISGNDSYWLHIRAGEEISWIYGAYVNIIDGNYQNLPVKASLSQGEFTDITNNDFSSEKNWLVRQLSILENYYHDYKKNNINSVMQLYDVIKRNINEKKNIQPLFLSYIETGVVETSRFGVMRSSQITDFLQENYVNDLVISPLYMHSEDTGFFWISGFTKNASFTGIEIEVLGFSIHNIKKSDLELLKGKVVIDDIIISPYEKTIFPSDETLKNFLFSAYRLQESDLLRAIIDKEFGENNLSFESY